MTTHTQINSIKKPSTSGDIILKCLNIVGPIASVLLATLPLVLYFYCRQPQELPISATFTKNNQTVELEVARKPSELYHGLKFRNSIPENRGMLFVVNKAEPIRLWMKDTHIPLDMVFMRDGIVNEVVNNAIPCKTKTCPPYGGKAPSNQIIEVSAGKASALGIKIGDKIDINYLQIPSQSTEK
jgi:uncharacterized protein